jgi:hypothetical protein
MFVDTTSLYVWNVDDGDPTSLESLIDKKGSGCGRLRVFQGCSVDIEWLGVVFVYDEHDKNAEPMKATALKFVVNKANIIDEEMNSASKNVVVAEGWVNDSFFSLPNIGYEIEIDNMIITSV